MWASRGKLRYHRKANLHRHYSTRWSLQTQSYQPLLALSIEQTTRHEDSLAHCSLGNVLESNWLVLSSLHLISLLLLQSLRL